MLLLEMSPHVRVCGLPVSIKILYVSTPYTRFPIDNDTNVALSSSLY